jgi:hypothetical protein
MSEERTIRARVSIPRILGVTLIALSVGLNALLFLAFSGPAMTKVIPTDILFTPYPYVGLIFIGLGVLLIRSEPRSNNPPR